MESTFSHWFVLAHRGHSIFGPFPQFNPGQYLLTAKGADCCQRSKACSLSNYPRQFLQRFRALIDFRNQTFKSRITIKNYYKEQHKALLELTSAQLTCYVIRIRKKILKVLILNVVFTSFQHEIGESIFLKYGRSE